MPLVKHALGLLLLLGAMIGLFGQAAAYASIPAASPATVAAAGMSADCMARMPQPPKPTNKPCTGMTLECIAAMGCIVHLTLAEPFMLPLMAQTIRAVPSAAAARPLTARSVAPDPEPPARV